MPADRAQAIYRIGLIVAYVYSAVVVALIVRLEILRRQGRLPAGVETLFSPIPGPMDTWGSVWGKNSLIRWVRLFRAILTDQHTRIGDQWTTMLVYASRILLVAGLGFFAAELLTGEVRL